MSDASEAAPPQRAAAAELASGDPERIRAHSSPRSSRYRIESEIARGGMGVVFRAHDQAKQRVVALKRPLDDGSGPVAPPPRSASSSQSPRSAAASNALPRHAALLEREYRTLVSLKHPRVIEVFDYGFDEAGPYYTMELLDGDDLKTRSPLPWREVCSYMRDVASCLALLHARGLVHRDVSPSNIRLTSDGRAKLLDFGALVPFGRHDVVAGTPSGVAPEALDGLDLDERVDLYALGATAYHALTGAPAYPARALNQLRAHWAHGKPAAPSTQQKDIPAALDELVLALISLDPLARPASAAEVIDRLSVIADFPHDDDQDVVRSYLRNPTLVGREEARARIMARLKRTMGGRGGTLLIEGSVGHGKSASLRDLEREARLLGATTLAVNARAHQTRFGTCRALYEQAVLELGERVRERAPAELQSGAPAEANRAAAEILDELDHVAHFFVELAGTTTLVLAVDDADHMDVDSAAVLTQLADSANARPLWLTLSADADSASDQVALRVLRRSAIRVRLTPLVTTEVEKLTRSTFGDVPGIKRLSAWLVEQTSGSPMLCMELLSELVDRGLIRYEDGSWILPPELPKEAAATTTRVLERRLERLSGGARSLAECMSAQRSSLSMEVCRALARDQVSLSSEETARAIEELVAQHVIVGDGRYFAFTQSHLRNVLYEHLPPAGRVLVHRQIGEYLARDIGEDPCRWLEVGCHFSFAGDEDEAARYLRPAIGALTRRGEALVRAVPDLVALRAHYQKIGVSEGDGLRASMAQVIAGLYVNPGIQDSIGEQTVDLLEERAGLALARRLTPKLGSTFALVLGVFWGWVRYWFSSRTWRFNTFSYPLAYFGASASMIGVASLRLDRRVQTAFLVRLQFLQDLSLRSAARVVLEIVRMAPMYAAGRFSDALPRLISTMASLPHLRYVDDDSRAQFEHAMRFWIGRARLLCFGHEPLEQADRMSESPSHHDRILAEFLRYAYHLNRGESFMAEPAREKLDALSARYGSSWAVDLLSATEFVPYHLCADVVGLKRCVQQLEVLVMLHPTITLHLDVARAMYEGHRGRPAHALEQYEAMKDRIEPFSDPIWSYAWAHRCECLNALGRHAEAEALAREALKHIGNVSGEFVVAYQQLEREAAMAASGLGRHADAARMLDQLLDRDGERDQPLVLGLLHRDRARVAVAARDRDAFFLHADEARVRFRATRNPALMAQVRRLAEQARLAGLESDDTGPDLSSELDPAFTQSLGARADASLRGQRVLDHVVTLVGASRARLYVYRTGKLALNAQYGEDRWDPALEHDVEELVHSFMRDDEHTAERTSQILARSDTSAAGHVIIPLIRFDEGRPQVMGALALCGSPRLRELSVERLARLASALAEPQASGAPPAH